MNGVIFFNQILMLLWNAYFVFNDLEPFSSSWRGHYAFVSLWPPPPPVISSSLKCQKCPEKRKQSTIMPFSLNILSRTFLSCGFCYYLYLGRYSFIFFMCLFLSVHLESGDIIFFILWRGDMKLWKGVLRIISYYLKV